MKMSDLLKQRDGLKVEAQQLIRAAEDGDRAPSEQEQTRLDEIRASVDDLDKRIRNQALLDEIDRQAPGSTVLDGDGEDDEFAREKRRFSLCRLIASTFDPRVEASREREICAEQRSRTGKKGDGLLVPFECLAPRRRRHEQRVLTVAGDGSNLISTEVLESEFIDALRPMAVAGRLGARTITGLTGDIALPRRDARTPSAAWYVENNAITSGDQSFDQVAGTPHHLGVITEYGRKTLLQASPAVEQITREHFMAELAVGIDLAVLKGAGSGGEPTGITLASGINTHSSGAAAPSWTDVLSVVASVEGADVPPESLGWALNAAVKARFKAITKVANDAGAGFLMV